MHKKNVPTHVSRDAFKKTCGTQRFKERSGQGLVELPSKKNSENEKQNKMKMKKPGRENLFQFLVRPSKQEISMLGRGVKKRRGG
jgi:hypothetical protein